MKRCYSENESNTLNGTEKLNKSQCINNWEHLDIYLEFLP